MKGKHKGSRREIGISETALLAAALTSTDYPKIDMKDKGLRSRGCRWGLVVKLIAVFPSFIEAFDQPSPTLSTGLVLKFSFSGTSLFPYGAPFAIMTSLLP
jgi:hypothetical protein